MPLMTTALRYFDEVARQGSIRRAADHLHVAASAVNRQILKLEDELGVPLFERLPRGLRLSSAGELLVYQVRQWQRDERQLLGVLDDIRGTGTSEVRVASVESVTDRLLPVTIRRFMERYPRVRFDLSTDLTDPIIDAILSGEADIGLCINPPSNPRLRTLRRLELRFGAVMAPWHSLAKASELRLKDFENVPVILPDQAMFRGSTLERALSTQDVRLSAVAACGRILSMKSLAREGVGVAFLNPLDVTRELAEGELVFVPLRDRGIAAAQLEMCVAKDRPLPLAIAVFAEMLDEALKELDVATTV